MRVSRNLYVSAVVITIFIVVSVSIAAAQSLTVITASMPDGAQNNQYSATLAAAGGMAPLTWTVSSGSLPTGLSLNASTGVVSGVPTFPGASGVTFQVSDANSNTATKTLSIAINAPYASGYSYSRAITIDHRRVTGSDQTDFPVLISGTAAYLATVSNGGRVQSLSGFDIVFTSDAAGQVRLDHEIDSYDGVTGTFAFWVRIPLLSHLADTSIYMWYGNSSVSTSQENKTGLWQNNFKSVYHFGSGSGWALKDSASSHYDLTAAGSGTPGGSYGPGASKIGGGVAFNGNGGNYLYHDSVPLLPSGSSPLTLEAWTKFSSNSTFEPLGYGANSATGSRAGLWWSNSMSLEFQGFAGTAAYAYDTSWHHVVAVYSGGPVSGTSVAIYIDGSKLTTSGSGTPAITTTQLKIGGIPTYTGGYAFNGNIDEVRISSGTRTADWIGTEYNNQSSPSTFAYVSPTQYAGTQPLPYSISYAPKTFNFGRRIAVDHGKIVNSDQFDFPILISGTFPFLATTGNGGHVQNTNGYDIEFSSDPSGNAQLDHEIDSYDPVSGKASFWVRVPTLSHTADTSIYMWYGNSSLLVSQENASGVWKNGYSLVHHYGNGTALSLSDSSANGNVSSNTGISAAMGKIGGSAYFPNVATDQIRTISSASSSIKPTTALTLEAWANPVNNGSQSWGNLISMGYRADSSWNAPYASYALNFNNATPNVSFTVTTSGSSKTVTSNAPITYNQWNHITATYDGTAGRIFINGIQDSNFVPAAGSIDFGTSGDLAIGLRSPYSQGNPWNGSLDEIRISRVARSVDWIATEYNNQSSPSTFVATSSEQTVTASGVLGITTQSLPIGVQNTAYGSNLVAAGGPSPYSWSVQSGTLPTGLSLNGNSGQISGTPTTPGTSTFVIQVADANNTSVSQTFSITINTPLQLSTTSLPNAAQGNAYSGILATTGGAPPINWSVVSGVLPRGLSLNAATGVISGIPLVIGNYNFSVQAKDAYSDISTGTVELDVLLQNGYAIGRSLVIDHTKIPNADLADFPVLVSGVFPFLASTSNGGAVRNSNGFDIIFTSDVLGNSKLDHEIESYDSATGTATFWVRVPVLSHSSDTTIYLWAGNASVNSSQENKSGVWRNGYVQVWHKGGLETTDTLGTVGSPSGISSTVGKISNAGLFATSSSNALPQYSGSGTVTVSAWVKRGGTSGDQILYTDWTSYQVCCYATYNYGFDLRFLGSTNQIQWMAGHGSADSVLSSAPLLDTTAFHYVVGLSNGSQNKLYLDGSPAASPTASNGAIGYSSTRNDRIAQNFVGVLDEVRLSSVERSANWIAAEFNNQSSPNSFYRMGLLLVTAALPNGTQNSGYSASLVVSGGVAPYTWSITSGGLPPGLNLDPNSGNITGIPTAAGAGSFIVQVSDSSGATTSRSLILSVSAPIDIQTVALPSGVTGKTYSATLAPSGGVSPYVWTISAGTLPGGLSLDANSGSVNGIPISAGSNSFTLRVLDSNFAAASKYLSIVIGNSLQISTATLPAASRNSSYSTTLNATGGSAPYTWSILTGNLPAGLSLNGTSGAITGTPAVSGSYTFVVQVMDGGSAVASAPFNIQVKFSNQYALARNIVIDHTKVANTDQSDFPVIVSGTYPFLATVGNGGAVQNSNGFDIIFTSDSAGQLKLDHEIESYDPTTGAVNLWVRVPALSHTTDTTIYMWAGNSAITSSQENKAGVWRNGYVQVWHRGGLESTDSLGTVGSSTGITAAPGELGQAGVYAPSSSNALPQYGGSGVITVSGWIKRGSTSGDQVIYTDWTSYQACCYSMYYFGFDFRFLGSTNQLQWMAGHGGAFDTVVSTNPLLEASSFHYVVGLSNGTQNKMYIDGVSAATPTTSSGNIGYSSTRNDRIGQNLVGMLDEVHLSSVERSADWIATEYNNQSAPSAFYRMGVLLTTATLPPATQNSAYSVPLSVSGGASPYVWTLTSGSLPAGLTLNQSSGVISGIPAYATSSFFTVQVQDANGSTAAKALSITVNQPLSILTTALVSGTQSVSYSAPIDAAGGVPPLTYVVTAGALPSGLSLDTSSGVVTGTPSAVGTSSFTVQVADVNGSAATQALSITINSSVHITSTSLSDAVRNGTYNATLTASGGATPYSWTIISGTLPDGLSLNSSTGVISGTPTTLGSSSFVVQVQDSNLNTATAPLSIKVDLQNGFSFGRAILLDHTKVPNTDQIDFPVLVSGTFQALATSANGGYVRNSSGYDVIFTSDPAGQQRLDYEIESYDPTIGAFNYWVRIPVLSHTTDTTIYMWAGNPSISSSQENRVGLWRNGYAQVWHKGGQEAADTLGNQGVVSAVYPTTGLVAQGGSFDTSSSNILSRAFTKGTPTPVTFSGWVKRGSLTGDQVIYKDWDSYQVCCYQNYFYGFDLRFLGSSNKLQWMTGHGNAPTESIVSMNPVTDVSSFHFVAGVNTTTLNKLYVDGAEAAPPQISSGVGYDGQMSNRIGQSFAGILDELRLSSVERSADWIATEYNNQSSPALFFSFGADLSVSSVPGISGISPMSGPVNTTTVTINGSNFGSNQGDSTVTFNGVVAPASSWSDTQITVTVPNGAATGIVVVRVSGIQSNGPLFTVTPAILAITPGNGIVDSLVTLDGTNFGSSQGASTVDFNGTSATASTWSDTQIVVTVPTGATTGPINLHVAGNVAQSPIFVVKLPQFVLTDSLGHQTTYTSLSAGGDRYVADSDGPGCSSCSLRGVTHRTYDALGNVLSTQDALGHTTSFAFDNFSNLMSQSSQLDSNTTATSSYTYNAFGEVLTVTDALGHTTTNTYDTKGNLLSVTTPAPDGSTAASVTQFAYNSRGQLTQITDPLNHVTAMTYTAAGLIETITDAANHVTTYEYDLRGNRTAVVDAMQHRTEFAYDAGNRLTTITYPDSTTSSFGYDYRGRRTSATDQSGKLTTYSYDDADHLLTVTDAAQHVTTYTYDTENNLTSITDALGHTTSFIYDAFGRLAQTTFPSTLTETYGYDEIGNLTSKTDRKGVTISYVYDALNRLTHKGYPDSTGVEYVYDLVGKVQQVNDSTGNYGFAYDNVGRLVGTTTQYSFLPGTTFTNTYTYDAASNRLSGTDNYTTLNYTYDTLDRLTNLSSSWAGSFGFGYDDLSRRTRLTRPNGVNTIYSYDNLSRLQSVLHQLGGVNIDGASYGLDNSGNRTSRLNLITGTTENYSYDDIYQLSRVLAGNTATENYSYDVVGNRLSDLTSQGWSYNASNQLGSTPTTAFTYDNNGNTMSKADSSGITTYWWTYENRLMQVQLPGDGGNPGVVISFKYDPFGRRIQKSGASGTSIFAYDGANIVGEYGPAGALVARYTQGAGIDEPLALNRSGATSFYEADGLGSITSLTDGSGSAVGVYTYDAFGKVTSPTISINNPFQYTGRERDQETGLYFYRARFYEPQTGRFISEDPIRFAGSSSFYVYTQNRPINATDPTGLKILFCSRAGFQPYGVGNHSYLYDTRNGRNCGRGDQSGKEDINSDGTFCVEVAGSDGLEDEIMNCCQKKRKHPGLWFPWVNDCHNLAGGCIEASGLKNPGAPGGRVSCRGNCKPAPYPEHEQFRSGW